MLPPPLSATESDRLRRAALQLARQLRREAVDETWQWAGRWARQWAQRLTRALRRSARHGAPPAGLPTVTGVPQGDAGRSLGCGPSSTPLLSKIQNRSG